AFSCARFAVIGLLARLAARLLAGERGRDGVYVALLPAQVGERLAAAVIGLGQQRERPRPLGLGVRALVALLLDREHHHHGGADLGGAIDLVALHGGLAAHLAPVGAEELGEGHEVVRGVGVAAALADLGDSLGVEEPAVGERLGGDEQAFAELLRLL